VRILHPSIQKGKPMAKAYFAIERPRKITIAIEGYNPRAQAQAQAQKLAEKRRRAVRQQKRAPVVAAFPPLPDSSSEAVEALAASALQAQDGGDPFTEQLLEAFAPGSRRPSPEGGTHAGTGT
jgi:hypothetical protein